MCATRFQGVDALLARVAGDFVVPGVAAAGIVDGKGNLTAWDFNPDDPQAPCRFVREVPASPKA